ncbi:hypothetical protein [Streptomyces sp. NPDC002156]
MKNRCRITLCSSLLVTFALLATGCSSPEDHVAGSSIRPASSSPAASPEPRALTQAELEAARLTEGDAARYVIFLGDETVADLEEVKVDVAPAVCLPAAEVLFRGRGKGLTGYASSTVSEPKEFTPTVDVKLTSYPADKAEQVFSMMERSLPECRSFVFRSAYGEAIRAQLVTKGMSGLGDEAINMEMLYAADGVESFTSYVLVRTGGIISYFRAHSSMESSLPEGKKEKFRAEVQDDAVSRQVAKVDSALRAGPAV